MITVFLVIIFSLIVAIWLWLPLISELWAKASYRRTSLPDSLDSIPRLLFLVPAHDEEAIIAQCVHSIKGMDYPLDHIRIVVIADNCEDQTAEVARVEGVDCIERNNLLSVGKPHALAWAINLLKDSQWDACVIIDADTVVHSGFAKGLAAKGPLRSVVVQGYFSTLNESDSWLTRLAGVLARCRYEINYPLRTQAGLNCPLTGNGMCIGRDLLEPFGWQAFSLTENWELYAGYTVAGVPIRYAENALLYSLEVSSLRQGYSQRRRWLAGRLLVAREWVPQIARSSSISLHQKLDSIAELTVPPPALHFFIAMVVGMTAIILLPFPFGPAIGVLVIASLASLVTQTAVVIMRHPNPGATLMAFALFPLYIAWRLVTALRTMLTLGDQTWRKTNRN